MKRIISLILAMVGCLNTYGQFYSIEQNRHIKNVEIVTEDTVDSDDMEDDLEESENIEETADIPDSLTYNFSAVLPLKRIVVTSPYGTRTDPFTRKKKQHKGIDLKARHEYPVAMTFGKVLRTGYNSTAGNFVTLQHGDITVSYCHLSKIFVKKNDIVYPGSAIGLTGSTGRSTGEHLHLTIRLNGALVNPFLLLNMIK